MEKQEKLFWTPDDVRHEIFDDQVSKSTLLNLLRSKKIPSIRLGRRWYIPSTWVKTQVNIGQGREEQ